MFQHFMNSFGAGTAHRIGRWAAAAVLAAGVAVPASAAAPVSVLYSFAGSGAGAQPYGGLVQAADGYLYGTTLSSAIDAGWGVLYRVKPDGSAYQVVHAFTGEADGGAPRAGPTLGQDGALYGSTSTGTDSGARYGTLWRYVPGGAFSTLHVFSNVDGSYPGAALVQDSAGMLYGVTGSGGGGGRGVVFRLSPDGSQYLVLSQFSGGSGGAIPRGVTLGADQLLYGVTAQGGPTDEGVVFQVGRDGNGFKVLHSFNSAAGEGNNPQAPLALRAADGYLYGTTNNGGAGGFGTVFRINAAGDFATVLSLDDIVTGAYPTAPLMVGKNGHLYGTAPGGGTNRDYGTLFEIDAQGRVLGVVPLTASAYSVQVGLTEGGNGKLYTAAYAGGTSGNGAVIETDAAFPAPIKPLPTETIYFNQLFPPQTTNVTQVGKKMQLHWVSQYATSCVAGGSWSGRLRPEGIRYVSHATPGEYPYTLTCRNANGATTTSSTLIVLP